MTNDLPIGDTTGICHESSAAIDEAAAWYCKNRDTCERPVVIALRRRFGLSPHDAVRAIAVANGRRA